MHRCYILPNCIGLSPLRSEPSGQEVGGGGGDGGDGMMTECEAAATGLGTRFTGAQALPPEGPAGGTGGGGEDRRRRRAAATRERRASGACFELGGGHGMRRPETAVTTEEGGRGERAADERERG